MYKRDVKGLLRASIDGFAHMGRDRQGVEAEIDDELVALLQERLKHGVCNPPTCSAPRRSENLRGSTEIGTIEAGKSADFLVLDANPLTTFATPDGFRRSI